MTVPPQLFDHFRHRLKIERAQKMKAPEADFLVRHVAQEIADRLVVINRDFVKVVDISLKRDFGTGAICQCKNVAMPVMEPVNIPASIASENRVSHSSLEVLGDQTKDCDLIFSCLRLHWINDLPGLLRQIRLALKPDGLFMAVLPAQGTLFELQDCILKAETAQTGGAGLRIDPFMEVRQVGDLLTRAGFALPVTDVHQVTVRYTHIKRLVSDLRGMAATSSLVSNRKYLGKSTFDLMQRLYRENYSDEDGKIRATFKFIFLSGWAPHESQQKPLARGSAKVSLKSALEP